MAANNVWLDHRGTPTALVDVPGALVFATEHPEGLPTAIYRLTPDDGKLAASPLPTHALALAVAGDTVWASGADQRLYAMPAAGGAAKAVGDTLAEPARALVAVDGGLAALVGATVVIVNAKGATTATFDLPAPGTALAADASGRWLMAGTQKGHLAAFESETSGTWAAGDTAAVHEGAVTALAFEPDALRVISAGQDAALKLTHARGRLDSEDRGGRAGHVAVALRFEGEKLYSAEAKTLKGWAGNSKRPQTWTQGVGPVVALAATELKGRRTLAVATRDGQIRLFLLDGAGKIDHRTRVFHDAYAAARHAFGSPRPAERLTALDTLAGYDDAAAIELIHDRATSDDDHGLRVAAVERLGRAKNARAIPHLTGLLRARTEGVRMAAFTGLRLHKGPGDLEVLNAALAAGAADVGIAAIEGLQALARTDAHPRQLLTDVVNHATPAVREAAIGALEGLVEANDAWPSHVAAASQHPDVRWLGITRLVARDLLGDAHTAPLLRRLAEDADANVRRGAFLARLLSRPMLAQGVRSRDATINRQLHELSHHGEDKPGDPPKIRKVPAKKVVEADRAPLLEALAARALDTCVAAAAALAGLEDPRAFGTLLQLSRESDSNARVEATRAFEALGDARALPRLRQLLRDADQGVRDGAFSALSRLLKDPLDAAEAGLLAPFEDVRRRALRKLLSPLRRSEDARTERALTLVGRALDDAAKALRSEAFKAVLNLQLGGEADGTLRFALRSSHADVRREVLTEVMAELTQPWAWALLLDLLDDPDPALRAEAFEFARKKGRGRTPAAATQALASKYADVRLLATKALASKPNAAALGQLAQAVQDADAQVRRAALDALKAANDLDRLAEALSSPHDDVQMAAAAALADQGDDRAAKALLKQLAEPEPETTEARAQWIDRVKSALTGLAALETKKAADRTVALLDHADAGLRAAAAEALAWLAPKADPLVAALRHADEGVRKAAALGLARLGHNGGLALLFQPSKPAAQTSNRGRRRNRSAPKPSGPPAGPALEAALALRDVDLLTALLEHPDEATRRRALKLVMMMAWRGHGAAVDHLTAALSTGDFRVRLLAAEALDRLGAGDDFNAFVVERINARDADAPTWHVDADVAAQLADALVRGDGRLAARALPLLAAAEAREAEAFERAWTQFARRNAKALEKLAKKAPKAPKAPKGLEALVFGAYVGLSRLGDRARAAGRARRTACDRLAALATAARVEPATVWPALLPALADDARLVREAAFTGLSASGFAADALAQAALATGNAHVGALALDLLSQDAGADGDAILENALRTRVDGVQQAALERLVARRGVVAGYTLGLEAIEASTRRASVRGLEVAAKTAPEARAALRGATGSVHADVRVGASMALGRLKDEAAFDALVKLLYDDTAHYDAIGALIKLGDPRSPDALLDRLDQDQGTGNTARLISASAEFRLPETAERLFALYVPDGRYRDRAQAALHTLTGYDQWVPDAKTDAIYAELIDDQHPRHDALAGRFLLAAIDQGAVGGMRRFVNRIRWASPGSVDEPLGLLCRSTDDAIRRMAVKVVGWRLKHRAGATDPLLAALEHRDAETSFEAARALADGGNDAGLSMLLTAIDLGSDLKQRVAAVEALGALGDVRALDPLLRLANEDGHALQEAAATAIGQLAEGDQKATVFGVLKRLAAGPVGFSSDGLASHALSGLRWFGGPDAWAIIRAGMEDDAWSIRERAAELLEHDPSAEANAALAKRIREDDDWDVATAATRSLRARTGPDDLAVDYALIQGHHDDLEPRTVERLAEKGDAGTLFALLPKIRPYSREAYFEPLADALRAQAPVAAAVAALDSADDIAGELAAHIVGQGGDAAHGEAVHGVLETTEARWTAFFTGDPDDARLPAVTKRLARLVWAAGRTDADAAAVIGLTRLGDTDHRATTVRVAALTALAEGLGGDEALAALEAAATGTDGHLRTLGAAGLARRDAARAEALVPKALDDRAALARLITDGVEAADTLRDAAGNVHTQGVTLPHLIARGDIEGLGAAAADAALPEAARQGALEALARIADEAVDAKILAVATADHEPDSVDEALCKAAWRALRRARRLRARQAEVRR